MDNNYANAALLVILLTMLLTGCASPPVCDPYNNVERRCGVEMSSECPWPYFTTDGERCHVCFKEGCGIDTNKVRAR